MPKIPELAVYDFIYNRYGLLVALQYQIWKLIHYKNISLNDLSRKISISVRKLSEVLSTTYDGSDEHSLSTFALIAYALDVKLNISLIRD